ncbi:MAG: DUF6630 family protein [Crocinitomicaceae bacterium]
MNFIKKLFSKSNKKVQLPVESATKEKQELQKENVPEKIVPNIEDYTTLALALMEQEDKETESKIVTKFDSFFKAPETIFSDGEYYYDTENNKFQAYRGNGAEIQDFPLWFLMLDTLQFNKYLWELDWKTDPNETNAVLKILAERKNFQLPELSNINAEGMESLDDYFKAVNEILASRGMIAIEVQIDSDSYVTGLVKQENFENMVQIANSVGRNIIAY